MDDIIEGGQLEKVIKVAAGLNFSLALTESGKGTSLRTSSSGRAVYSGNKSMPLAVLKRASWAMAGQASTSSPAANWCTMQKTNHVGVIFILFASRR